MSDHMYLEVSDLRGIITGGIPVRRCPDCEGSGVEWWLHYTLKECPKNEIQREVSADFAAGFCIDDYPDYDWAECERYDE